MILKASFDDGTAQDLKVAALMAQYGVKDVIFYFPVKPEVCNEPFGRISLSSQQRKNIASEYEIGSHTITHPLLTRIDFSDAEIEITESRRLLQEEFGQDIESFCYPRGYSNPAIQEAVVKAGYDNARSTLVGYVHETENPYFEQTALHVACDRKEYAGLDWFDYGLKLLEIARKVPNSVFHFWGHSWEIEQNNQWDRFEQFLQELVK